MSSQATQEQKKAGIYIYTENTGKEGNHILTEAEAKEFASTAIFVRPSIGGRSGICQLWRCQLRFESKPKALRGLFIMACTKRLSEKKHRISPQ